MKTYWKKTEKDVGVYLFRGSVTFTINEKTEK